MLTAAHFVWGLSPDEAAVLVGTDNYEANSPSKQALRIASIKIHPQYTMMNDDYDVATINLKNGIVFSDATGPICLPFK